ncbi:hypothetical protein LCGC14_1620160 [marine sediment metagenome]|uniref:Uncharacterized protein n=1 Tax=marine sediment metagenome TaxID=412755 RepID=A0A0F9ISL2_9ZZZZ
MLSIMEMVSLFERGNVMTWAKKMQEFGGGNFTFLSVDGEVLIFIVVGEPQLLKSTYKGKTNERIGCPIVTDEGYMLFICGKRLARKISKLESSFETKAIMAVRHGTEGDVNAKYEVSAVPEKATFERLQAIKKKDFKKVMIAESVADSAEVLNN